jgi:hypothetical protein
MTSQRRGYSARDAVNALMMLAFTASVIVQVNDPDPLPWMLLYGAAATACLLALLRRDRWWLPALTGAITLAWAASLAPRVIGNVPFLDMFGAFEMKSTAIEESREMYGLLLVAGWMAVLAVTAARAPARARSREPAVQPPT